MKKNDFILAVAASVAGASAQAAMYLNPEGTLRCCSRTTTRKALTRRLSTL